MRVDRPVAPRPGTATDAPAVAALHAEQIPEGFLVTLGARFLQRLYARVARSDTAFLVVTEDATGLTGFVAVAERTGQLYREFLLHDGVAAALAAAPAVLRAPRRTWETLRYGAATEPGLPAAEVLSVAVAPRVQGRGVGRALMDAAVTELRARGVASARVVTTSENDPAIRMYSRAGFRRHSRTEVHAGVVQEVLVWR